jgi:ABC-type sugar transport system substrate-binding protein
MLLRKRYNKTALMLLLCFSIIFSTNLLSAEPSPEEKSEELTIAMVYHRPTIQLFSTGIHYQSFMMNFQRKWERLAEQHGFNLMVLQGGTAARTEVTGMRTIITRGVDGVLSCYLDPSLSGLVIREIHAAGIPVVAHGAPPPSEVEIPYVGIDDYKASFELGKTTAKLFNNIYETDEPKIMILNARTVSINRMREDGFVDGFREVLPDGEVVSRSEDDGSIAGAVTAVQTDLIIHPEVNVVFGTNDYRAHSALLALQSMGRGTLKTEILVGFGGSILAMKEVMNTEDSWRVQLAVSFNEIAELSYSVLQKMIDGELPIKNRNEYIVEPHIFVNPKKEEIEDYIEANYEIEDIE